MNKPTRTDPRPVLDPAYWADRIKNAGTDLRLAVYHTSEEDWKAIEQRHRCLLARLIKPTDAILDAGCAYGRLLDLLPPQWRGNYLGVDLSPDFIRLARELHPRRRFVVADLRDLNGSDHLQANGDQWDVAVLISVKYTLIGNCGYNVWTEVERALHLVARRLLFLEYDPKEEPDHGITPPL